MQARWYVVAAAVVFFVVIGLGLSGDSGAKLHADLLRRYTRAMRAYKEDSDKIDDIRAEERKEIQDSTNRYQEEVREIRETLDKSLDSLSDEQIRDMRSIMNDNKTPDQMATEVSDTFGLPVRRNDK